MEDREIEWKGKNQHTVTKKTRRERERKTEREWQNYKEIDGEKDSQKTHINRQKKNWPTI